MVWTFWGRFKSCKVAAIYTFINCIHRPMPSLQHVFHTHNYTICFTQNKTCDNNFRKVYWLCSASKCAVCVPLRLYPQSNYSSEPLSGPNWITGSHVAARAKTGRWVWRNCFLLHGSPCSLARGEAHLAAFSACVGGWKRFYTDWYSVVTIRTTCFNIKSKHFSSNTVFIFSYHFHIQQRQFP